MNYLKSFKRFLLDFKSLILFKVFYKNKVTLSKSNYKKNFLIKNKVTVVITSCDRTDNLKKMLLSFLEYNTANIEEIILVEDGGSLESVYIAQNLLRNYKLTVLFHKNNTGQLYSIDEAYRKIKTEFIFHIEEDWIFIKKGFIEYSLMIFNLNRNISCLSLRPHSDWKNNRLENHGNYNIITSKHSLIWGGTGINPGLYRTEYYRMLGNYSQYHKERIIAQAYSYLGFIGAVSNEINGYLYHDGSSNSTRKLNFKIA